MPTLKKNEEVKHELIHELIHEPQLLPSLRTSGRDVRVPLKFVRDSDHQEDGRSRVNNGNNSGGQTYIKGRWSTFPEDH